MTDQPDLADNLLRGAPAIARYLHGSARKEDIRRVYHEAATGRWPIFKEGGILFALKTRLRAPVRNNAWEKPR